MSRDIIFLYTEGNKEYKTESRCPIMYYVKCSFQTKALDIQINKQEKKSVNINGVGPDGEFSR